MTSAMLNISHAAMKAAAVLMEVEFDFTGLAIALAAISLGGIGMIMAGYFLFPDTAQKYKKEIPTVIIGLVLVAVAGGIVSQLQ